MYKRFIALLAAGAIIFSMFSGVVFAENTDNVTYENTEEEIIEPNEEIMATDEEMIESPEAPGMMIPKEQISLMSANGTGLYQISVDTYLHVRSEPNGSVIGSLNSGDCIWIVETSGNWGRYDGGWISLNYANLIGRDTMGPTISNVRIAAIDNGGFNILCDVADDYSGVSYVSFPTWTKGDQSDIVWEASALNGNTADCRININLYNNAYGHYNIHIYAYDNAGNCTAIPTLGFDYSSNVGNIYTYITNQGTNKVLGINGSNVELQTKRNDMSQIWRFEGQSDGSYHIINCQTGKALDVYASSGNSGANVQIYPTNDGDAQKWFVNYGLDGEYRLRAKCTGCVLDVNGGGSADGTNIQMWSINNANSQKFGLKQLDITDYITHIEKLTYENNQLDLSGWAISKNGNIPVVYQIDDNEEITVDRYNGTDVHNAYPAYASGNERFGCVIPAYDIENGKHKIKVKAYVNGQYSILLGELEFESYAVSKPSIDVTDISGGKSIKMNCKTSGAEIYYTLDGTDPSTSSTRKKYSSAVNITKIGTYNIKAVGIKSGYANSEISTSDVALSILSIPTVSSQNGKAVISGTGTVYYTTNGTTPTTSSIKYLSPFSITNGMIIKSIAVQAGTAISEPSTYYTVVYNLNGGTGNILPQVVKQNSTIILNSVTPSREGYNFKGWATSSSTSNIAYKPGNSYKAVRSLTLYAVWEKKSYTIEYNANGGVGEPENQTKFYGTDLTLSTVSPMKENYVFKGWAVNQNSSTVDYNPGDIYSDNDKLTLYAVWEKKTFTISYDANGGNNAPGDQYKTLGEPLILTDEIPDRPGYRFLGWTISEDSDVVVYRQGGKFEIDAGLKLYAVWTPEEYSITLNTNGGTINSGNVTSYLYLTGAVLPTDVSLSGYTFDGWYDNEDFSGNRVVEVSTSDLGNKVFYAKWTTEDTVSVTYDYKYNGGTSSTKTNDLVGVGDNADLSPTAEKDGWEFVGWNTSANATSALSDYEVNGAVTLYAIYKKTLTANFYSGDKYLQESKLITIYNRATEGVVTAPQLEEFNGWYTSGWRNDTTAADRQYNVKSSIPLSMDTNYYAVYYRILMLSYNANGGSETPISQTGMQYYNAAGNKTNKTFTLSSAIKRDNYKFEKWAENNVSGKTYNAGESISIENDTTMYALWSESTVVPPTPTQTPTPKPDIDLTVEPEIYVTNVSVNGNIISVEGNMKNDGNWNMNNLNCIISCQRGRNTYDQEVSIGKDNMFSADIKWSNSNTGDITVSALLNFEFNSKNYNIESNSKLGRVDTNTKKYLEISPRYIYLYPGQKSNLFSAINNKTEYTDEDILWESSNEKIVSVNQEGVITANNNTEGNATITAKIIKNGKSVASSSAEIEVSKTYIPNNYDFSEWNMFKSTGPSNTSYGWGNTGGNATKALSYLTRWNGPLKESDDPYEKKENGKIDITGNYHVQEAIWISPKAQQSSTQKISENMDYMRDMKTMLVSYGGIYASLYYNNNYFADGENKYYYYTGDLKEQAMINHAITIVGWDDTIDKSLFKNNGSMPRDNGAFICKNSYGKDEHDNGYFYISYDDVMLGKNTSTVFNNIETFQTAGYNKVYQYDHLGATTQIVLGDRNDQDKSVYCANIFTNDTMETEKLKAVSTYVSNDNEQYEVYVIKNIGNSEEEKKQMLANGLTRENLRAGGVFKYKGYHTIDLKEDIDINAGENFAIVFKFMGNLAAGFYVETGSVNPTLYKNATANDGESFASRDGKEWLDCNSEIKDCTGSNVCIKAFTKANNSDVTIMSINEDSMSLFDSSIVTAGVIEDDLIVGASNSSGKLNYNFEKKFDLRGEYNPITRDYENGYVTPVKDQGDFDSCWSFAAYGSLESCLKRKLANIDKSLIMEGAGEDSYLNASNQNIPVSGICIDETSKNNAKIIAVGDTKNVNAYVLPRNADNQNIVWTTSNENIVQVDEFGNIQGLSAGVASVIVSSEEGEYRQKFAITVEEPTTNISEIITDEKITVQTGQRFFVDYTVTPYNAVGYDISISSGDDNIVAADSNGILTAMSVGETEIEIKAISRDGTEHNTVCKVTVDNGMDADITVVQNSLEVFDNMTFGGLDVNINNKTDSILNADIYVAAYDENDRMISLSKIQNELETGDNAVAFNNLKISGIAKKVKVFVWNTDMMPYAIAVEDNI